uniref:Uncharacterized protein n=1 Tax=Anguilla anguilla TaxID=7936 RepID=A0A0E9U4L5_ANGAN
MNTYLGFISLPQKVPVFGIYCRLIHNCIFWILTIKHKSGFRRYSANSVIF